MKRKLIALCVSSVLVGSGIVFNMNQDVSVPTVEKFTEDTSTNVSKHEDVEKDTKTKDAVISEETESKESRQKEKSTAKSESKTTSVSSEGKRQDSKKESDTKSSSGSDQKVLTSNSSNASSKSNNDVVKQPVEKPAESKKEPVVEPTPEPARPSYACPGGVNPNTNCDMILDTNFYYATYGSQAEADAAGMYYLDEVMYIGDIEITNYSVQPVYRNNHSIAYYGLNLWSNGTLIQ